MLALWEMILKFRGTERMLAKPRINELSDLGKGRAFVVLFESEEYRIPAETLFADIAKETRCLLVQTVLIDDANWQDIAQEFRKYLTEKGVRQASFVCLGAASAIVLDLALRDLKQVRSMVLVDACTRPHPTLLRRIVDRIEAYLPLGLPLRSRDQGFDAKSFLQRLRCPILVVTTERAGSYIRSQAGVFMAGLPTAWSVSFDQSQGAAKALKEAVLGFQQVPAKCPQ